MKTWAAEEFEPGGISRFCDVVMKGGVTSGVVYPPAICRIASKYLLKNIGGTSVGAIAAAVTAAAEYRRRTAKSGDGYVALSNLPRFLTRRGTLQALFTADPGARSLLNTALKFTGSRPIVLKIFSALIQFWWQTLVTGIALYWAAYGILLWITGHPDRALFFRLHLGAGCLMLVGLVPVVAAVYFVLCKWKLDTNDFGLAHGYHPSDDAALAAIKDATDIDARRTPRLIGWLDVLIQQAAGVPRNEPLTFGALWCAPDPPWYVTHADGEHGIEFRMVTTCLTLGRPFELPFEVVEPVCRTREEIAAGTKLDPRPDLYFEESEMRKLFPKHVVDHLVTYGGATSLRQNGHRHKRFYRLPEAKHFPIIVAARMSMSFPVLFSAVRLYAPDFRENLQPVWFSDGGVTSNFPIHFFDSPLPRWPTFAIDLLGSDPQGTRHGLHYDPDGDVFLESERDPGTVNPWNTLGKGDGNILGFFGALLDTARTWLDEMAITLPANSTRTLGIRLKPEEGGINLTMPASVINRLLERGQRAGVKLLELFANGADTGAWRTQRWMRYRGAMSAFDRWQKGYHTGYEGLPNDPQANYEELIRQLYASNVSDDEKRAGRIASALTATKTVATLESIWCAPPPCDPAFEDGEPLPFPVFAQRRPL